MEFKIHGQGEEDPSFLRRREGRVDSEKASGNIGFRGAGKSGPEADFDQVKSKIGGRREGEAIVGAEEGAAYRRHVFLSRVGAAS
jgi:hypothetical protein